MDLKNSQTTSINSYFLRIYIPIVLIFSVAMSSLLAWNDFQVSRSSRLESQKLIFETFQSTVRQPLIQGSSIEAKVRAAELTRNKQVPCVQISTASEEIVGCNENIFNKRGLNRLDADLYFNDDTKKSFAHVAVTFDNSDLLTEAWKKAGKIIIGFALLASALFLALSFGFSRIRSELSEILKIADLDPTHSQALPKFKISEFSTLGKNLLRQLEIAKSIVEAKAALEVAKHVAHDIRSPILSLQMAIHASQNKLDPKVQALLNHSAQRISDIADDVISQHMPPNQNEMIINQIKKLPMSVNLALKEMVSEKTILCAKLPDVAIQIKDSAEDMFIEMRVSDFKRVISNLIDNAIHAVGDYGSIKIESKKINNECQISISDSGIGMSDDILKIIFEKGGSFGKQNGKGLGFQWAKKTLEKHSGRIEVLSKEGNGTVILLFLPRLTTQAVNLEKSVQLFSI